MLLVAAIAFAVLIILVGRDVFRGETAIGRHRFFRASKPLEFWCLLAFYLTGALAILTLGIISMLPDCVRQADGTCTVTIEAQEPSQ